MQENTASKGAFRARSGRIVQVRENGTVTFDHANGYLSPESAMDAEEFFQAQKDLECRRWRCPVEPDHVVYEQDGQLRVMRESDGHSNVMSRRWFEEHREGIFAREEKTFYRVLALYVEAHPEPKPWHDAQPGEVWAVTETNGEALYRATRSHRFEQVSGAEGMLSMPTTHWSITAARKIWPEDAS